MPRNFVSDERKRFAWQCEMDGLTTPGVVNEYPVNVLVPDALAAADVLIDKPLVAPKSSIFKGRPVIYD